MKLSYWQTEKGSYLSIINLGILIMLSQNGSSSSSGDYARYAGNTRICELGCYVDLNGSLFEVPQLNVEQNCRWVLVTQSVDVIYPHGVAGADRIVVHGMSYRQRRGGRTVSPSIWKHILFKSMSSTQRTHLRMTMVEFKTYEEMNSRNSVKSKYKLEFYLGKASKKKI